MAETRLGNYALGLAGLALVRAWHGDEANDRCRALVDLATRYDTDELLQYAFTTNEHDLVEGYTTWSDNYDTADNPMIVAEEATVIPRLEALFAPGLVALDAGCGTGRHSRTLTDLGYQVIGTDLTPAMLDIARTKVPEADFREGVFEALPLDDASVDLITSALAVCHATHLGPVFAEFARVLKPGGRIVISDPHPVSGLLGGQAFFQDSAAPGTMPFVRNQAHPLADYVAALLAAGFTITGMDEIPYSRAVIEANPTYPLYPATTRTALEGVPFIVVWEAQLTT